MSHNKPAYPKLPEVPEIARKWQFHRLQMIGIPLIMLIPLLALFGLFGKTITTVSDTNTELAIHVTYPARFRYKTIDQAHVSVQNVSAQPIPVVRVYFDHGYINSFSTVTFTPDVKTVTDAAYIVELTDLQPQETRIISVQLQAEKYWQHKGEITATLTETAGVEVPLSTFVFP